MKDDLQTRVIKLEKSHKALVEFLHAALIHMGADIKAIKTPLSRVPKNVDDYPLE